jgi:DNA-binding SARP family transcriptional activator
MTDQDDIARDLVQRAHAEEVLPAFDVEAGVSDVLARAQVEILQLTSLGSVASQTVGSGAHRSLPILGEKNAAEGPDSGRRGSARARDETSGHGGASGVPTQPGPLLLGASPGSAGMELRVLGPVEAVVGGRVVDLGPPKQRALFALLASRVGRPVAVDVLLEALWAGAPPPAALASLRAYVANLRRVLEPGRPPRAPATVLRTHAAGYLLENRDVDVDVHRFTGHATTGREAWGEGDPQRALSEFEAGLALWRGEAYAEVADSGSVAPEVARLEELRLSVIEGRYAALIEVGDPEVAVAALEAHVQAHPLREYGCELLTRALYRAGRQADALALLRATRTRLAEELGPGDDDR